MEGLLVGVEIEKNIVLLSDCIVPKSEVVLQTGGPA